VRFHHHCEGRTDPQGPAFGGGNAWTLVASFCWWGGEAQPHFLGNRRRERTAWEPRTNQTLFVVRTGETCVGAQDILAYEEAR